MTDLLPFGDETDEAVCAFVDGELDDFAVAHGITPDDVSRRLGNWSGFDDRRRELTGARAALATQPPPLAAPTRRQLVREALATGGPVSLIERRRRRTRLLRPIAAVAACVVILGAIGYGLSRLGGGSSGSSSKSASTAVGPKVDKSAFVGDVGDVSAPAALRMVLTTRLAGLPAHAPEASGAATQPSSGAATPSRLADGRDAVLRCASAVDAGVTGPSADTVVLLATARFQGRDAFVIGVRRGARSIVFVADRASCAVLTSQSA